ncbi:MAG: hypothetical protein RL204_524 [Bacteroidota bacterium]|jgi:hypothetical protein
MAIKILINGYYRSGTTMLFNQVNQSLPSNYIGFYEPCYPLLGLVVRNEEPNKISKLHGSTLWKSYQNLDESDFIKLLRNHPNTNKLGIANDKALLQYLDVFNGFNKDSFLQTNRYHLFLEEIKKEYSPTLFHIIRDPNSVYDSIKKAYTGNTSGIKKIIKKIRLAFGPGDFFGNKTEFSYLIQKTGKPKVIYQNWKLKYFSKPNFYERVIINWTLSNYYALQSIARNGDKLIVYEEMMKQPTKVFSEISQLLGFIVAQPQELRNQEYSPLLSKKTLLYNTIQKFKLEQEFEYINEQIKYSGIQY